MSKGRNGEEEGVQKQTCRMNGSRVAIVEAGICVRACEGTAMGGGEKGREKPTVKHRGTGEKWRNSKKEKAVL